MLEKAADGSPKKLEVGEYWEQAIDGKLIYSIYRRGGKPSLGQICPIERSAGRHWVNQRYLEDVLRGLPDVLGRRPASDKDRHSWLPGVIVRGDCRARPGLEAVDGAPCIALQWKEEFSGQGENGKRTKEVWSYVIWCDPKLGYAMRKREMFDEASASSLRRRDVFSQFVEVAKGVWLPRKMCFDLFASAEAPARLHNVPLVRSSYQVSDIHANDVLDKQFFLTFPPGVTVVDRTLPGGDAKAIIYTMPADAGDLDAVIRSTLTKQRLKDLCSTARHLEKTDPRGASAVGRLLAVMAGRRWRNRGAKAVDPSVLPTGCRQRPAALRSEVLGRLSIWCCWRPSAWRRSNWCWVFCGCWTRRATRSCTCISSSGGRQSFFALRRRLCWPRLGSGGGRSEMARGRRHSS